jgi:hypothetical protein
VLQQVDKRAEADVEDGHLPEQADLGGKKAPKLLSTSTMTEAGEFDLRVHCHTPDSDHLLAASGLDLIAHHARGVSTPGSMSCRWIYGREWE